MSGVVGVLNRQDVSFYTALCLIASSSQTSEEIAYPTVKGLEFYINFNILLFRFSCIQYVDLSLRLTL